MFGSWGDITICAWEMWEEKRKKDGEAALGRGQVATEQSEQSSFMFRETDDLHTTQALICATLSTLKATGDLATPRQQNERYLKGGKKVLLPWILIHLECQTNIVGWLCDVGNH